MVPLGFHRGARGSRGEFSGVCMHRVNFLLGGCGGPSDDSCLMEAADWNKFLRPTNARPKPNSTRFTGSPRPHLFLHLPLTPPPILCFHLSTLTDSAPQKNLLSNLLRSSSIAHHHITSLLNASLGLKSFLPRVYVLPKHLYLSSKFSQPPQPLIAP